MNDDFTAIPTGEHWLTEQPKSGGKTIFLSHKELEAAGWCPECKQALNECTCVYDEPPPWYGNL